MAAVRGTDDLLLTAALAAQVAVATLEEIQRRDGLEDEMEENAPRVKLAPRCSRKKRDISIYVWSDAAAGRWNLSNPTSNTAKQFRTDFHLPYILFFSWSY